MKIQFRGLLRYLILPLWLAITAHAVAQAAKIAVIADPTLGDLVDATTAQLSTIPDLSLVERSDLEKVGREQALKEAIATNDVSSIQFVPADGLLILKAVKQDGKTGILARLVAVQPGIVLREVALSDGADSLAHANEIVKEFAPYWPKLAQIQKGKISALSLLGLRFELDGPETRELERKINLLLAIRLGAEPDTVVLERWRLNDALFEKSLAAQQTSPFWTGSSLIDGSMKWENKVVEVSLRVRPPNGPEVSITDQDSADHLSALVDRLANKIQAHPIAAGAWQSTAEARHYAELGKWCLDNGLKDQGAEAIESALALGDDSPATHRLQIRAYASLAFTDELSDADSEYIPEGPVIDPASLPDRVKWGTNAAELAGRYWTANANFSGPPGAEDDPATVCLPALDNCLRLLGFAYEQGYAWDHPDETTDLRHAAENLISQMEPVLAKRPPDQHDRFLRYQVHYAPYWHETPEATVAYYRDLLNRQTDGVLIRKELFESSYIVVRPPLALREKLMQAAHPEDTMPQDWVADAPWMVAWENRPPAELAEVFRNFQQELSASPDPVLRSDELKSEFCLKLTVNTQNDDTRNGRLVAFLQQNRDCLVGERGNEILAGFKWIFWETVYSPNTTGRDALRALGSDLLNRRVVLPSEWLRLMPRIYFQAPPDVAQMLLARLDAYRQWYQTQSPQDPDMIEALNEARRPLAVYAGVVSEEVGPNALTVNRHWPLQIPYNPGLHFGPVPFPPSVISAENKAWFLMFGGKEIHCVDTNFQNDSVFTIPDQFRVCDRTTPGGVSLGVTPQYLVVCVYGRVLLLSRTDSTWRALDLPPSDYKPCWVNQQLYLLYDVEGDLRTFHAKGEGPGSAISGLIRVSLPDGGSENLVSTRRIPPQSPLDGKPLGFPLDLWNSASGLMLAVNAESPPFQVFATPLGKNDWAQVMTDPLTCDAKPGAGGELIGKGFDDHGFTQLVLVNGTDNPVLLSNPGRTPAKGNQPARWDTPEEIRNAPPDELSRASAVMRGDDLCLYRDTLNASGNGLRGCLYYFTKGQKSGLRIPLKFEAPGIQNPAMIKAEPYIHNFQSLQATDYGLVMVQEMGGFWVIPWSDIDAYRAHAGPGSVATSEPAPAPPFPIEVPPAPPRISQTQVAITPPAPAAPPTQPPVSPISPAIPQPAPKPVMTVTLPPMRPPAAAAVLPLPRPALPPPPAPPVNFDNRD